MLVDYGSLGLSVSVGGTFLDYRSLHSTLNHPLVGQEPLGLRNLELDFLGFLQETVFLKLKPATTQVRSGDIWCLVCCSSPDSPVEIVLVGVLQ